jgi:hypothetical protein
LNDWYTIIILRRHPKNTDGFRGTRMESPVLHVRWRDKVLIPDCDIFRHNRT